MSDHLEVTVTEHALQLGIITSTMGDIKDALKDNSKSLAKMADAMKSQELIMEKLSNIDEKYKASIDRLHEKLDAAHVKIEKLEPMIAEVIDLNKRIKSLEGIRNFVSKFIGTAILTAIISLIFIKVK